VINPPTVRSPCDDEPSSMSFAQPVNPYAPTTAQCPPIPHYESRPVSFLTPEHDRDATDGSLYNEQLECAQLDITYPGEDEGCKVSETHSLGHAPQLEGRLVEEEIIGHNWVKRGSGTKVHALLNHRPANGRTGRGHKMRWVSRMAALRSKLHHL
jgi:hypothetical protein